MARLSPTILLTILFLYFGIANGAQVAGWIEQARLEPAGIDLKAKMDTGAENSSVNALDMAFFVHDGTKHVRFKVRNKAGKTVELVRPLVREASIRRHFSDAQKRPVVLLTICIGNVSKEVEVSLVDRAKFNYPLLVGRSYLAEDFLIDSARTFLLEPGCGMEKIP